MRQRVNQLFDNTLIEFGLLARYLQLYGFAQLQAEIAHQPGKTTEHMVNRHHADRQHALLDILHIAFELRKHRNRARIFDRIQLLRGLAQHGVCNHQLSHQIDQLVDFVGAHMHGNETGITPRFTRATTTGVPARDRAIRSRRIIVIRAHLGIPHLLDFKRATIRYPLEHFANIRRRRFCFKANAPGEIASGGGKRLHIGQRGQVHRTLNFTELCQFIDKPRRVIAAMKKILRRSKHDDVFLFCGRHYRAVHNITLIFTLQQQLQFTNQVNARRRIQLILGLGREYPIPQAIDAAQQDIGAFGRGRHQPLAHAVEHRFHLVREFGDYPKAEAACRTFE